MLQSPPNRGREVAAADDHSATRWQTLRQLLMGCEIAATAPNGKIALAKLPQIKPDVVTLDIEMPEMNGLETLLELRKQYPTLPVIMFSTLTERGAEATLEALANGASDYVTKPANVGSVTEAMQSVRRELVPKIKSLCPWYGESEHRTAPVVTRVAPLPTAVPATHPTHLARIDVVAIGVSTGGPNALMQVLPQIPKTFPAPIVIVQHMPPLFTKHLADRLNQLSTIEVVEGKQGDPLRAGTAYIAPGDWHMSIKKTGAQMQLDMTQTAAENSCRPAVDVLFRSVSQVYGSHALALVLTGMGHDGLRGAETVRKAGGRVLAQDQASSVVWGMPRAIVDAGLADQVLPLNSVAQQLCVACQRGRTLRQLEKAVS